jgi:hypothetical protein
MPGMTRSAGKAKRWRIGIRGILYFTTAIGISIALLRFALSSQGHDYPAVQLARLFAALFGQMLFGAAIGGLCGQLLSGTRLGVMQGALFGGIVMVFCCGGILVALS